MNERRIQEALADPQASADQLARALATVDLRLAGQAADSLRRRHETVARKAPGSREERRAAQEMLNGQAYFERACRHSAELRRRLEAAEARERAAAERAPKAGIFIRGHALTVAAGDADGTTFTFTLSSDELRSLGDAAYRAAARLEDRDDGRPAEPEAVAMRASA